MALAFGIEQLSHGYHIVSYHCQVLRETNGCPEVASMCSDIDTVVKLKIKVIPHVRPRSHDVTASVNIVTPGREPETTLGISTSRDVYEWQSFAIYVHVTSQVYFVVRYNRAPQMFEFYTC